jgi:hypothetical protein
MDTVVKSIITLALLTAIAWPLLFWGHVAAPAREILRESSHVLRWAPYPAPEPDMGYSLRVW